MTNQLSRFKLKPYRIIILLVAIMISYFTTMTYTSRNISPCLITLPFPCNASLDDSRINYTRKEYGFPAKYKITALSERIQPTPYVSSSSTVLKFNWSALLVNVMFWYLVLNFAASKIASTKAKPRD